MFQLSAVGNTTNISSIQEEMRNRTMLGVPYLLEGMQVLQNGFGIHAFGNVYFTLILIRTPIRIHLQVILIILPVYLTTLPPSTSKPKQSLQSFHIKQKQVHICVSRQKQRR